MKTPMQELIEKLDKNILLPSNWREKYLKKEKEVMIKFASDNCIDFYHENIGEERFNETFKQ